MGSETVSYLAQSTQKSLSLLISIICFTFVSYQGFKCWIKYSEVPRSTDVSIAKAHRYPDVTICPRLRQYWNGKKLYKCGLTDNSYFDQNNWTSNVTNCTDSEQVYEEMVGTPSNLISYLNFTGYDEDHIVVDLEESKNFRVHDHLGGRCYTFNWPEDFEVAYIDIGSYRWYQNIATR